MKKILVIEDNKDMRENICEILDLAGYEVSCAENGREGIKQVNENLPDLVVCDVMMPELDGYGVLHILSSQDNTAHIPFIFLTAKGEKGDFRKGMNLGADDYITKPFEDLDLLEAIEVRLKKAEKVETMPAVVSISELMEDQEVREFEPKSVIYREGQAARGLYYIKSGQVKTERLNEDGKILITGIFGPGETIGHLALISDTSHQETAVAMEPSEISLLPSKDFKHWLYSNPKLSAHFIKLLAHTVKDTEDRLEHMAYDSVRKRVANALIYLEEKFGEEDGAFTVSMLRDDLASLVGMAKETLIRTLSSFKSEGLVTIEHGDITILNKKGLSNIIG